MSDTAVIPRLRLIEASPEALRADLAGPPALAGVLHVQVPAEWPPPLFDDEAIRFALDGQASGAMAGGWGFYYIVLGRGDHATAIGIGGFKGGPDRFGQVEVGYSVLPQFQGQGFATEALRAFVTLAVTSRVVETMTMHTLRGHEASIRVAKKVGFTLAQGHVAEHGADLVDRYEYRLAVR